MSGFSRQARVWAWLALVTLIVSLAAAAEAREQYQMNHPSGPPPSGPIGASGNLGMVPAVSPDFWTRQMDNRLPPGTTISGVVEGDVASHKSKSGDTFAIVLAQPFFANGREVIPVNSKILATVVSATPAAALRHGQPGNLEVALSVLQLPDGQTTPIYGFIDHNPNLDPSEEPGVRAAGHHISDWGKSVSAFFGSFTSGIGRSLNRQNRGVDFKLENATPLTVRLNRSLDVPVCKLPVSPALSGAGVPPLAPDYRAGQNPAVSSTGSEPEPF